MMKITHNIMCIMFIAMVMSLTWFNTCLAAPGTIKYYHDCDETWNKLSRDSYTGSGVYTIKPDHLPAFDVYCDMDSSDGGWTVIQRRMDGSVDFNHKWKDYVVGFGDLNGEFWLGLSKIHRLIASVGEDVNMTLLTEYQHFGGPIENATYEAFKVLGPSTGYQLSFVEISDNHSQSLTYDHNNMKFSTDDVDNDLDPQNSCALRHRGAWWYNTCLPSQFNAPYPIGLEFWNSNKDDDHDQFAFMYSEMKLHKSTPGNYSNCKEALESGHTWSGIYTVNPDDQAPFKVYCDMETDGGGWAVFQRRQDGSVDFFRGWEDYENGFGNLNREFWLGLDKIHRLTIASHGQQNTLRFDLGDHDGNKRYAKYSTFQVADSTTNYTLTVTGYSGDASDSFSYHTDKMFTTNDNDHDTYGGNCAHDSRGAWWYDNYYGYCHFSNLNGIYSTTGSAAFRQGINWYYWTTWYYSLKFTEMKVRQEG